MMNDARASSIVALHNFLYYKNKFSYFGFVEGGDDRFLYYDLFKSIFPDNSFYIVKCDGKRNMATVMPLIEKQKNDKAVMFIMDGDYINKEHYKNLYNDYKEDFFILDVYSLENLYCDSNALKEILKREYGFIDNTEDMNQVLNEYNQFLEKNEPILKIINTFFYIQRVIRKDTTTDFSLINKNKLIRNRENIEINLDNLCCFFEVIRISDEEKEKATDFFKDKSLLSYCRGHNLISCMKEYLKIVHKNIKENKYRSQYMYSGCCADNILNHCVYAVQVPQGLKEFLNAHCKA